MNRGFTSTNTKIQFFKQLIFKAFFIFFIILSFFLIFISKPDSIILNKTKEAVINIFSPIATIVTYPVKKIQEASKNLHNTINTKKENDKLKEEINDYKEQIKKLEYVQSENNELKKLLNFPSSIEIETTTAEIIADTGSSFSHSIIINAGQNYNIKKNQPVIANGSLIGQVVSSGSKYSRILLITDSTSNIPVMIERTRTRAFMTGNNSKFPDLIHFENKIPITVGDKVITSGLGGDIPKGIPIGIVASNNEEDGILVQPFTDYSEIEFIKIIKTTMQQEIDQFKKEEETN